MRFARQLLIFSYGLFTIAAQTLLFREFVTAFEGTDISIGIFFASWFLWVALGAVLVNKAASLAEKLLNNIDLLFLAYLPAFIIELVLIIQARQLVGAASYMLLPVRTILLLSIVINAPVSVITGMLFPISCRWIERDQTLPVSHVYMIEAAGSFFGGVGTTVLLAFGFSLAAIFFVLAFILSTSVFCVRITGSFTAYRSVSTERAARKKNHIFYSLLPLFVLICLAVGADKALMRHLRVIKWTRLLPAEALTGSFQTPQAEYLYGVYQGQWLAVREGSVVEALPDETTAGRIAAAALAQKPDTARVLVIGSGLGLCRQLLRLPQIESVTWTHCDNQYVRRLSQFIPPELKVTDGRLHRVSADVRELLAGKKQYYDIAILNLPEATNSVLNRYYTYEFYNQVKKSLSPNGLLAVCVAGGENIMGTELVNLGASVKLTLEKVFSGLVLTPGEQTWFFASDANDLTGEPGVLRQRFAKIDGAKRIFSPDALLSVYLPDRAAAAIENYCAADLPERLLINLDSRPLTHLYSLLLAAKQSGTAVTRFVKSLALAGSPAIFIPIFTFIVLRLIYILRTTQKGGPSGFDSAFLVFSTGSVAIGVVISLCYLYQTRFGSLYLHIGVISSLFMLGLTAGAILISNLVAYHSTDNTLNARRIFFIVIPVHISVVLTILFWPAGRWTHLLFAVAFILCGLCSGCYFPLAAKQLADCGFQTGRAGAKLESADHLGASAGGLLTSLVLLPVLGTRVTLLVFVLLILANVPPALLQLYRRQEVSSPGAGAFNFRAAGYALFGIAASVILCSNLLAYAAAGSMPPLPHYAAQSLAGRSYLERKVITGSELTQLSYFDVYPPAESGAILRKEPEAQTQKPSGYIFSSRDFAPDVRGFGGRINLAVYVDAEGRLIDFHIMRSNETPAYLELLTDWRELLKRHGLFQPEPFTDIDAVTGATVSSQAILTALQESGRSFAEKVLHESVRSKTNKKAAPPGWLPDANGTYLIAAFALSLFLITRKQLWQAKTRLSAFAKPARLAILGFSLLVGGIILNAQFSTEQIVTLLSLHAPEIGLTGAFLMVAGVPLLVIFFGNIYCGYICPFGAAQELLSCIVPERFRQRVSPQQAQKAGFIRYLLLFILIILFFLSRNRTTLTADPLVKVFAASGPMYTAGILVIITAALTGSVFYTRFWCRYLCPTGAFLSLLNKAVILKRYLPAKRFGNCEFAVTTKNKMDCLYCDRCRYPAAAFKPEKSPHLDYISTKLLPRYFVVGVLVLAVIVSSVSVNRFLQVMPAGIDQPAVSPLTGGEPRDVDVQRIRTMIRQKKLSDREAEFYEKIE